MHHMLHNRVIGPMLAQVYPEAGIFRPTPGNGDHIHAH